MLLKKEMCVENYNGALVAQQKKADFIELCDNLAVGGTTPSYGVLKQCIEQIETPITVLIRARGGDFVYTPEEIAIMTEDILICKKLGYKSVRVGALLGKELHENVLKLWKDKAGEMSISCHMAFDELNDYYEGIDRLIALGYMAVLTKGGAQGNAISNQENLAKLVAYAGDKMTIIPGSGITVLNVETVQHITKAKQLHGTKIL